MHSRKDWLLAAAAAALVVVTAGLAVSTRQRVKILADTGETRAAVRGALARILPATVSSGRDARLLAAAGRLADEPYVVNVWIVDREGALTHAWHGVARPGQQVRDLAGEMPAVLAAMPPKALSEPVGLQLLTIAAMRRDGGGDHNDVWRHLVRPVPDAAGGQAALVAVAFDVSPAVGRAPDLPYLLGLLGLAAGFAVYWLGLPLWVYLDARARGEAAVLWGLFVLLANLVGLVAYLLVIARPRRATGADDGRRALS